MPDIDPFEREIDTWMKDFAAVDRSPRLQKIMDSLVLSNIAHRPARTAVSIAGIALGVLLVVFTVGLAHGLLRERGG